MANLDVKDAAGATKTVKAAGAGTGGDPLIPSHNVDASALPTGAATETTLAAQSAKLPAALGAGGGLKVDGSGTALPVSGTVTVNALPAGTNNIGDVDVLTLPALPTGANAIGKLAANSGVDIGDIDVTSIVPGTAATNLGKAEDAAHTSADVGVMALGVRTDTTAARSGTDGDYEPFQLVAGALAVQQAALARTVDAIAVALQTDAIMVGVTALTPKFAPIAAATSGANTLVAAVTSKKIRVLSMFLLAGAAGNIYFTTAAAGAVIFGGSTNKINLAANGGFVLPFSPTGWFETVAGDLLNLNASSTGPFSGGLTYVEV